MADFAHVLRRVDGRLRAPEPHRSRILLEIAQDLQEIYCSYLDRGCSEQEARERAEAAFGASDESLEALARVHAPLYARLLHRFSEDDRHRFERVLLTSLTLFVVLSGASSLVASGLTRTPSPLTWPLLGLVALSAWALGWAAFRLYLNPYRPLAPHQLVPFLGLAGASITTGVLALLLETWQFAGSLAQSGARAAEVALPYLQQAAALLTLSGILSLAILLGWFHLRRRALEIEGARRAVSRLIPRSTTGADE